MPNSPHIFAVQQQQNNCSKRVLMSLKNTKLTSVSVVRLCNLYYKNLRMIKKLQKITFKNEEHTRLLPTQFFGKKQTRKYKKSKLKS